MADRGTPISAHLIDRIKRMVPIYGIRGTARRLGIDSKTVMKYAGRKTALEVSYTQFV